MSAAAYADCMRFAYGGIRGVGRGSRVPGGGALTPPQPGPGWGLTPHGVFLDPWRVGTSRELRGAPGEASHKSHAPRGGGLTRGATDLEIARSH